MLVDVDSDDEVPPTDMYPKWKEIESHKMGSAHSTKTVHEFLKIVLLGEDTFLFDENRLYPIKEIVRGPARPTQKLREIQAMHNYSLEYCAEPTEAWRQHCLDPVKQAFRTAVILRAADVNFDFEATTRDHLLARISDLSFPELAPCNIYGTATEYEEYAAACDLATGTGWPTRLAQRCSERYFYHIRNLLIPMEDQNHTMRMQSDPKYCNKYTMCFDAILDVYAKEIAAIEQCRANEINFHAVLVSIGEVHRSFNGHRGNYHLSELPDVMRKPGSLLIFMGDLQTGRWCQRGLLIL
jgi:hypothetical protein